MGLALDQFKQSLELADSLKKLERQHYKINPKLDEQPFVRGLRGGAAVLMVAAFEFYLKRLFRVAIQSLNDVPVTIQFSKLPNQLKIKAVYHGLNKAMAGPMYITKPPKIDRIDDILAACKLLISEQVDPETFSETGSNPNADKVKEKFKEIGLPDIFGVIKHDFEVKWKTPVAHDFISSKLDDIVRTRHVVAHTADTLNISRTTQNESLKFLRILAELLEKHLNKHIKSVKVAAKK